MLAVCSGDSVKNKLDSLFSHMLFVPQASQSSFLSWSKFEILPTIPPAKKHCLRNGDKNGCIYNYIYTSYL